jgi:phosphoribosylanthranilate isomerase
MFAASGVYIKMPIWPPPFMMMGRQDCGAALKMTLSQGRPKCKKRRRRTSVAWIQPQSHRAILRHNSNMVISFLSSSINYLDNLLLPNDLIIVQNHGDDEEDTKDIKRVLERQGDVNIKVEIQSNLEFQSLTSSSTQSSGPPQLQIYVQDAYAQKEDEITFPMAPV